MNEKKAMKEVRAAEKRLADHQEMRRRREADLYTESGAVICTDGVTEFLYALMRDHLSPWEVWKLASPPQFFFDFEHLRDYAHNLVRRLQPGDPTPAQESFFYSLQNVVRICDIERMVQDARPGAEVSYMNGYLAREAIELAEHLARKGK